MFDFELYSYTKKAEPYGRKSKAPAFINYTEIFLCGEFPTFSLLSCTIEYLEYTVNKIC